MFLFLSLLIVLPIKGSFLDTYSVQSGQKLCQLTNNWRLEQGYSPIETSYTMNFISFSHLENLLTSDYVSDYLDDLSQVTCNLHSWRAETITIANISECCYPGDSCMTNKAREITKFWQTPYFDYVGENAYISQGSGFGAFVTHEQIIDSWLESPLHRMIMSSPYVKVCGAVLNTTYQTNLVTNIALMWLGIGIDQIPMDYKGDPMDYQRTPSPTNIPTRTSTTPTNTSTTNTPTTTSTTNTPTNTPTTTSTTNTPRPIRTPTRTPTNTPTVISTTTIANTSTTPTNTTNTNTSTETNTYHSKNVTDPILERYGMTEAMFITALVVGLFSCITIPLTYCMIEINKNEIVNHQTMELAERTRKTRRRKNRTRKSPKLEPTMEIESIRS